MNIKFKNGEMVKYYTSLYILYESQKKKPIWAVAYLRMDYRGYPYNCYFVIKIEYYTIIYLKLNRYTVKPGLMNTFLNGKNDKFLAKR